MNFSEILGSLGVAILLLAFVLNMLKIIKTESLPYLLLNFIGGATASLASWLIPYIPFVILEGVWAIVSMVSLVKYLRRVDS
jgi:cell shape-determining protein MreD